MAYDHLYNGGTLTLEFEGAPLRVFFPRENVVLTADREGNVLLHSPDGTLIRKDQAVRKDRLFGQVTCSVIGEGIRLRFDVLNWTDHYPHCDGEYDRWTCTVADSTELTVPV